MVATMKRKTKHRILSTREMAASLGLRDTDWVSRLCLRGDVKGAWRIGKAGNWRAHSADFRAYLVAQGISTRALDSMLAEGSK